MQKQAIGRSDLQVAPLALGGNVFGWTIDEPTSFQVLDGFVAAGFNLIDTADVYSRWKPGNQGGESETIIGNWLQRSGKRDKIVLATKVGGDMGQGRKDVTKAYILKEVEQSLLRLKTDYIDLYQTHWDDEAVPVEETLGAYEQLIKSGKVRVIGASNFSAARLKAALKASETGSLPRYESFQPHYNLYDRADFENSYQQFCVDQQLSVIPYYSLASGFLTGKYRSQADLGKSARGEGNRKFLNERGFRILAALDEVARRYQTVPASVALAWLAAQPSIIAPIASATSIGQLESLVNGVSLGLDKQALDLLSTASAY